MRVVATILMEPHKEGTQTGIALDGSGVDVRTVRRARRRNPASSPTSRYGEKAAQRDHAGGAEDLRLSGPQDRRRRRHHLHLLGRRRHGGKIEVVGDLRAEEAERHVFGPPREFGTGTQLLPAVKYFVERFKDAPWGFYVFITDGELHDLEAVKNYSTHLAHEVAAKKRNPLKFVLIGVGPHVNEAQMEELDDLDTGTDVDLWDHKLAAEMRVLQEIFAEVVDKNARIADNGRILDPQAASSRTTPIRA